MYLTVSITLGGPIREWDAFRRVSRPFMSFYMIPPFVAILSAIFNEKNRPLSPPKGARTDNQRGTHTPQMHDINDINSLYPQW